MARQADYNSAHHIAAASTADPYLRPAFSLENRLRRLLWGLVWLVLYRTSPRPLHAWRSLLLRLFGATMGPDCHFYPTSRIHSPWNLVCADQVTAADGVEIYNPAPIKLGSHAILSQGAYLCGATHDFDDPDGSWTICVDLRTRLCRAWRERGGRCCAWLGLGCHPQP